MRTWLLRLVMIGIVIIALIGVAVQILLTTQLPRSLFIAGLERQLGLRVTAGSMQTGWMGETTFDDVTLALPLAEESFLQVPRLKIQHSTLFSLLLRRPLHIDELHFDRPQLIIRQDPLGRWNLQEAVALITRAAGGRSADSEQKSTGQAVQLPIVTLRDGTLQLIDNERRKLELRPLEMQGAPERSLSWHFSGAISTLLRLEGRIAPGQSWNHQVEFILKDAQQVLRPWFPGWPEPTTLAGNWAGAVNGEAVVGRLDVQRGQIGKVGLTGAIKFENRTGAAAIQPQVLIIDFGSSQTPVRLTSGSINIAGTRIDAANLDLAAMSGSARLNGHYDWHARAGAIDAAWSDLALPGQVRHNGKLQASIDTPWAGNPQIKAALSTGGYFPRGDWDGEMTLLGTGPSWNAMDWRINVSELNVREPAQNVELADLDVRLLTRGSTLTLEDLRIGQTNRLRGGGAYDFARADWWFWLDTREITVPGVRKPVNLSINASGSNERVDVSQFYYRSGKFEASASASYVFDLPKPLDMYLHLWRIPIPRADDPTRPIGGSLNGELRANGTLWPRNMGISGKLVGSDVVLGRRRLGDVAIQIGGVVDEHMARIDSQELELLEGQWTLSSSFNFANRLTQFDVGVKNLSLTQADALFSPPPDFVGILAAQLNLELPNTDRALMRGRGEFSIAGLKKDKFKAEQAVGRVVIQGDTAVFSDVVMRQGSGIASGTIRMSLREPNRMTVDLKSQDWPVEEVAPNLALQLTGNTKVDLDLRQKMATGPLQVNTGISLRGRPVGNLIFDTSLVGKAAEVRSITGEIFDGTIEGTGTLRWDDILKSAGSISVDNMESARLAEMWPALAGVHGSVSGTIEARPAANPLTAEPLEITLSVNPDNAWYRVMSIGDTDARIFVGRERVVLESSLIKLAHGEARLWGRLSRHDDEIFSHAQMEFSELSINELGQTATPGAAPVAGALHGQITLFGPLSNVQLLNGEGEVRLTRSDLANVKVIGAIYDAMRLQIGPDEPSGTGQARLRLEQGVLHLTNLIYRNRGTEVRASGRALDIFRGGDSPMSGFVVGSARPLREVKLPFFAEADDIFDALQKGVTTFRVGGRINDPALQATGLSEIGNDLRGFILGDVTSEQRQRSVR
jgi:hypothetical protein